MFIAATPNCNLGPAEDEYCKHEYCNCHKVAHVLRCVANVLLANVLPQNMSTGTGKRCYVTRITMIPVHAPRIIDTHAHQ